MKSDILKQIQIFVILISFTVILAMILGSIFSIPYGNVAIIKIDGTISESSIYPFIRYSSASDVVSLIEKADSDPFIEAIILDINSPGGTVVASYEIKEAVSKAKKPIVALIHEIGTSGAYWIASAADKIIANNFSLVGSIGATASYLEFSKFFEKYGISYINISIPKHKDIGTSYRAPTEWELNFTSEMLEKIYDSFLNEVISNRNLTLEGIEKIRNGTFFLGVDALEIGLIDELGGMDLALNVTKELAEIEEAYPIEYTKRKSTLDILSFLFGLSNFFKISNFELKV